VARGGGYPPVEGLCVTLTQEATPVMMDGMGMGMGLWWTLVVITVIAVLVLAVLGSVWLWRQLRGDQGRTSTTAADAARDTLRKRYAAGEIDDQEYQRRLSALSY
jgi:putative membrane protein